MKELHTIEELDALMQESFDHSVVLYKHSTRCPISAAAHRELEQLEREQSDITVNKILVIEDRPVSNAATEKCGIEHHSPQVLIVKDGNVTWNASHYDVTAESIKQHIS